MMLRFAMPAMLGLALVGIAAAWSMARRRRRGDARLRLPAADLHVKLGTTPWQLAERGLPVLRGIVLVLLAVALARPQAGDEIRTVSTYGVDILVALDVSTSMMAEDFPGNRLEEARRTVKRFIDARPVDRIGLVVFAGLAVTRCPVTLDHAMLHQFLDEVDFAPRDQDGTALGMGLAAAVNRLRDSEAKSKIVVLVTDGRNNRGQIGPQAAAEAARALGIKVYTVGVGTEGEAPVPVDIGPLGRRVVMQRVDLDEPLLREIAEKTDGRYFRATDADTLAEVFATIDALEKTETKSRVRMLYTELFWILLAPGFGLLLFERLLVSTRLRRIP
jgi:Ca-activated chloride channel family protein